MKKSTRVILQCIVIFAVSGAAGIALGTGIFALTEYLSKDVSTGTADTIDMKIGDVDQGIKRSYTIATNINTDGHYQPVLEVNADMTQVTQYVNIHDEGLPKDIVEHCKGKKIYVDYCTTTLLYCQAYYDEQGKFHNDACNTVSCEYHCDGYPGKAPAEVGYGKANS